MTSRTTVSQRKAAPAAPAGPARWVLWALLAIVGVTVGIYARTVSNGFIDFDDPESVVDNLWIRAFSAENVEHWFTSSLQFMYTPLVYVSYAIDYAVGGTDPAGYHVTNLALHLVNVLLVFAVVRALTRRDIAAVFAAGAFAIHPVNVDGVAWVSARSNLMATAFVLASLLAYSRYLRSENERLRGRKGDLRVVSQRWWWFTLSLALFVAATFSKSAAVVLPVVLLLWDYAVARRLSPRLLVEKVPFFLVSLAMGLVGLHFRDDQTAFTGFTAVDRVFLAFSSLWAYLERVVLPWPLSFAYAYPEKDGGTLPLSVYLAPVLVLAVVAAVVAATFALGLPRRIVVFGWALFFVTNVLSLTVLLIDNYKPNRYAYLPYVGLFLILGLVVDRLVDRAGPPTQPRPPQWVRWTTLGVVAGFAVAFCALTVQRTGLWKDTITLLTASIEHEPDVPFVYNSLGVAKHKAGDQEGALAELNKVIELDPNFNVYNNLGSVQLAMGEVNQAIASYSKAIEMSAGYVDPWYNRGVARLQQGDKDSACGDWATARDMGFPLAEQALADNNCP